MIPFSFTFLESILFITFQCFSFTLAMKILEDVKYDKRDLGHIACFFIVPSIALFFILKIFAIVYFVVYFGYLNRSRNLMHSLLNACLCIIIGVISDHLSTLLLYYVFHKSIFDTPFYFLYFILFLVFMVLFSYLFKLGTTRLKHTSMLYDKTFVMILMVFLSCSIIAFYTLITFESLTHFDNYKRFVLFFLMYILFSILIIAILSRYLHRNYMYKRAKKENEDYFEYTKSLEQINQEMRQFKHDYINILSTMTNYIHTNDIEGLTEYFNTNIVPLKADIDYQLLQLHGLEKVHVTPLKGLLTTKIIRTQEAHIPLSIEVSDEIFDEDIDVDMIKLSRAIGIIWDNAIEASQKIDDPKIDTAIIKTEYSILFIMTNRCEDNLPSIHKLYQKGFSTKGNDRGFGLLTLKEISATLPNMFVDTSISNHMFIQKIELIHQ